MSADRHDYKSFKHGGRRFSIRWGNLLISKRQAQEMAPDEAVALINAWADAPEIHQDRDRSGYVYLAHMPATGHYKIGYSKTPAARVNHFDVQMPVKVNLVHSFPADDAHACEQWIHAWAEPWRVPNTREWFDLPGSQVLMIKYYRGYEDGQPVIDPDECVNLIRDISELPREQVQPHPTIKAEIEEGRKKREKELRERTDWPELERELPVSKSELKRLIEHVRSGVNSNGCDNTLEHTLSFADMHSLPEDQLVAWLQAGGGYCDCEVLANVADMWEWRL